MDRFLNALRDGPATAAPPRFGVVSSVDTQAGAARVLLQPDGVLTGWLPVLSPWVGAGWGLSAPPSPGDQVLVAFQEGDVDHGAIVARGWSTGAPAPATPSGELWLTHRTGSFIRLLNDGTVSVRGDVHVAGNVFVSGDVHDKVGPMDRLRQSYNKHRHGDPQGDVVTKTDVPD